MLPLQKSVWKILKTLKVDLPYDPAIPLLGISPKDSTSYLMDIFSAMFIDALFLRAKNWKQPKCPTDEQGEASASDWSLRHLYLNHAHLHLCTRSLLIKQQNALSLSFACCCCWWGEHTFLTRATEVFGFSSRLGILDEVDGKLPYSAEISSHTLSWHPGFPSRRSPTTLGTLVFPPICLPVSGKLWFPYSPFSSPLVQCWDCRTRTEIPEDEQIKNEWMAERMTDLNRAYQVWIHVIDSRHDQQRAPCPEIDMKMSSVWLLVCPI